MDLSLFLCCITNLLLNYKKYKIFKNVLKLAKNQIYKKIYSLCIKDLKYFNLHYQFLFTFIHCMYVIISN